MSVVFVVFPIAMVIVAAAVAAFIWAMRSGQFEDLETPGLRMLHEEEARERRSDEATSDDARPTNPE